MREPCTARCRFTTFPGVFMNRLMLLVLACIPIACSNDSTAPKASGIGGKWIYRIVQLSDGGQVSCSMTTDDTLSLGRSTATVAGSYSGGTVTCTGADVESIKLVTGAVVNGTVDPMVKGAQSVSFDLDGVAWHHDGSLIGDRMSGTLTVEHVFAGKLGRLLLTGSWTAQRKSIIPPPPQPL
jgi:hypothetical protein